MTYRANKAAVARSIVVTKDPAVCDVWHPVDSFSQSFEYLAIVDLLYGLPRWSKFFVDDSTAIKKVMIIVYTFDFLV